MFLSRRIFFVFPCESSDAAAAGRGLLYEELLIGWLNPHSAPHDGMSRSIQTQIQGTLKESSLSAKRNCCHDNSVSLLSLFYCFQFKRTKTLDWLRLRYVHVDVHVHGCDVISTWPWSLTSRTCTFIRWLTWSPAAVKGQLPPFPWPPNTSTDHIYWAEHEQTCGINTTLQFSFSFLFVSLLNVFIPVFVHL